MSGIVQVLPENPTEEASDSIHNTSITERVLTQPAVRKRPRPTSDTCSSRSQSSSSPDIPAPPSNASERLVLRTMTYCIYDCFSVTGGHKEVARIGKAFVELLVDEHYPPPHRVDMTLQRKCFEYLFAPAASSLIWFVATNIRATRRRRLASDLGKNRLLVLAKAFWTVVHRVGRQALICRLFFRIGSLQYSLASALGIVCCFFKESLFPDFLRFARWPTHFSSSQGIAAILRSIVYALAFLLPLQNLSKSLEESPRRRCNAKKIIFAIALSQTQKVMNLWKSLASVI